MNFFYGPSQANDPMLSSFKLYGSNQPSIPYQQQHSNFYYNNNTANVNSMINQSILNLPEQKEVNNNLNQPKISNENQTNANSSNNPSISLR